MKKKKVEIKIYSGDKYNQLLYKFRVKYTCIYIYTDFKKYDWTFPINTQQAKTWYCEVFSIK